MGSDVVNSLGDFLLKLVQFHPLGLLVVVVKVEHDSVLLELEHLFQGQTVQYPVQVDKLFPLFSLRLKIAILHNIEKTL